MKKAAIEIQTTWIFGIVAGIIFFIGIGSFINNQSQATQEVIDSKTLEDLRNTINTMKDSNNRVSEFELPRSKILRASCVSKSIRIGKAESQVGLDHFFAPKELSGKLKIWVASSYIPINVGPSIYLTDDTHFYLFVFDSSPNSFQEKIYTDFPETFGKARTTMSRIDLDLTNLKKIPNIKIRVVYLFTSAKQGKSGDRVTEVGIDASNPRNAESILESGPATFAKDMNLLPHYSVYPLIYGVIIIDSTSELQCGATNIFARGKSVSNVLMIRASQLSSGYSSIGSGTCASLMSSGAGELNLLSTALGELSTKWHAEPDYVTAARALNITNHKLLDEGCSNLY